MSKPPREHAQMQHHAITFFSDNLRIDGDFHVPADLRPGERAPAGGVVIAAAAEDERVRGVAACNPIGDGCRSTRFMHDEASWRGLLERIQLDRRERAVQGRSRLVRPFQVVRLDPVTRAYVDSELYKAAGFGSDVTLQAAEHLLDFFGRALGEPVVEPA